MFPRTTFKGINVSIKLHCEGYVVFISAVTVYEPRVLTVAWKGFCLGCRLALRCYSVKSLCLSGMNRGRGSRKRRSGVIWHGWAHEQVPLLLSPQGERERDTEWQSEHADTTLTFDSPTHRQQRWQCRRDSASSIPPSSCGRFESCFSNSVLLLSGFTSESWRGTLMSREWSFSHGPGMCF